MVSNTPPPTFRGADANGDWLFGGGTADYLTGQAAIAADIQTALQIFRGEIFWQTTFGVDWLNLLGALNTQATIVSQCSNIIMGIWGVVNIISVVPVLDSRTRKLSISYKVQTIYQVLQGTFIATQ